jgi:hypothetical protein
MYRRRGFEKAKWLADKAKTLATQGDMAMAAGSVSTAENETKEVSKAAYVGQKEAHDMLLKIQFGKMWQPGS